MIIHSSLLLYRLEISSLSIIIQKSLLHDRFCLLPIDIVLDVLVKFTVILCMMHQDLK